MPLGPQSVSCGNTDHVLAANEPGVPSECSKDRNIHTNVAY